MATGSESSMIWPCPVGGSAHDLYARNVLRDNPSATIIADVKSSQLLFDEIDRAGGHP